MTEGRGFLILRRELGMKAEIIAVGTELLLGQIVNTNAQFLSRECAALGDRYVFSNGSW